MRSEDRIKDYIVVITEAREKNLLTDILFDSLTNSLIYSVAEVRKGGKITRKEELLEGNRDPYSNSKRPTSILPPILKKRLQPVDSGSPRYQDGAI